MSARRWPALMIDCETLSTTPNALIVQLAAVPFDPYTELGCRVMDDLEPFNVYLDWTKCEPERNLCHVDVATVNWWMMQSDEARSLIVFGEPRQDAMKAADSFSYFMSQRLAPEAKVWSYGATADLVWVRHLLHIAGHATETWSYRNERCMRTIKAEFQSDHKIEPKRPHDALSDALAQADRLHKTLMKRPRPVNPLDGFGQTYTAGLGGEL